MFTASFLWKGYDSPEDRKCIHFLFAGQWREALIVEVTDDDSDDGCESRTTNEGRRRGIGGVCVCVGRAYH